MPWLLVSPGHQQPWYWICKELTVSLNEFYSIHVLGWLLKWLNLITAHGSVSNEPGSVTWLTTKYLKTVSWRNHIEKLTTLWPPEFWPKINIPSSYFTILMLNCLENTPVWQLCDSCQILDLINFQNNLTLPNSNTAGISLDSRLKYSKITHRYAKDSPIYAIKQIKICAEYRDMLPRPQLHKFVRYTWASACRPPPRFLTNQPWPG